jgi:hypothetical protein
MEEIYVFELWLGFENGWEYRVGDLEVNCKWWEEAK